MADPLSGSQNSPGFFRSIYDGAVMGDYADNSSTTKTVAQIGTGLIPVAGQIADARDTAAAFAEVRAGKEGGWMNLGFAIAGWVPAAGDFAKSVRKVGFKQTFSAIGDAFGSIGSSWRGIRSSTDEKIGKMDGLFYKAGTDAAAEGLSRGTLGVTNRFGDIQIREGLSEAVQKSTTDHEMVHRFFSPSFKLFQKFRADVGLLGYSESHLLRRMEEGMAESWSKFRSEGWTGIKKGWQFPYDNPYGLNRDRVRIERNIVLGVGVSAASGANALGQQESSKAE